MDNYDLLRVILRDPVLSLTFVGSYANDRLPVTVQRPAGLIINTQNSDQPGQHWVAVYIPNSGYGVYFDSLGGAPSVQVKQFLERNTRSWVRTPTPIQHSRSTLCGLYCIVFLYFMSRHCSLRHFLNFFYTTQLHCNDYILLCIAKHIGFFQ